jgi:hypothetical protein
MELINKWKNYSKGQRLCYDIPVHFIRKLHGTSGLERLFSENALPLVPARHHTQTERINKHFNALFSFSGRIFHDAINA